MKLREHFSRFMLGRYGMDSFSKTLIYIALALYLINIFTYTNQLSYLSFAMIAYCYYRMFSKNIYKRAHENQVFLQKTHKLKMTKDKYLRQFKTRKTHHIYKCPTCKQKIRVPKGRGRISIHCPKCNSDFIKKS